MDQRAPLVAHYGEPVGRSLREPHGRVLAEQYVPHRAGEFEAETGPAQRHPPGSAAAVGRFHEAATAPPVHVRDVPAVPAQQEAALTLDLFCEQARVDPAQLGPAGEHGELGWSGEDGGHVQEVAPSEPELGGRADEEHAAVDRKSTRLNSSHVRISYAVFCLKKK